MHLFFCPDNREGLAYFPEEEAAHCAQVLRHKTGDTVRWIDGQGGRFVGTIVEISKKRCLVSITEMRVEPKPRTWSLHLVMAPTKHMDRTEWMLEKAMEAGIDAFTPIWCERSERKAIREDRLLKIAVAAMKQSMQSYLPTIHSPTSFRQFVMQQGPADTQFFIAHCMDDPAKSLLQLNCKPGSDVCLLIGPEGDFSEQEVSLALQNNYLPVSLGPTRLRTETAAIMGCYTAHIINQYPK